MKIKKMITVQAGSEATKFINNLGDDLIDIKSYIDAWGWCQLDIYFYFYTSKKDK